MRIVFMGCTEIGFRCLEKLIEMGEDVVAVYTMPREFEISYANKPVKAVTHKSFEEITDKYNIPLITVTGKMKDYTESIKNFNPDFILVIGWYYMISKEIRDIPKLGCAGMHASLLPKYRGGAPINWAIINGEPKSGISFFYLEEGVDTGDIIGQREYPILLRDTCQTLYDKATTAAVELIEEYIPLIKDGQAPRTRQDHSQATIFPQRKPQDGEIDWRKSAVEIDRLIRAVTRPYPGAFTYYNHKKLFIWAAHPLKDSPPFVGSPGHVVKLCQDKTVWVTTGDGILVLDEIQLEDEIPVKPTDLLKSVQIRFGLQINDEILRLRREVDKLKELISSQKERKLE